METVPSEALDDRALRAIGIPAFGLAIPVIAGLYGPLGPADPMAWVGAAWFLALSAAIWHGNRWLLFLQRRRYTWWAQPWRRVGLLGGGVVLYTVPITVGALVAWQGVAGLPSDPRPVVEVALGNTICVLFVAHLYETLFLVRERVEDAVRVERLERARAEAQLAALRGQLDPHFVFNALNALAWLVESDPPSAPAYVEALAEVHRYALRHRDHDLVPLDDELAFVAGYGRLVRLRWGEAFSWDVAAGEGAWRVPPMAVQGLVENAVKHNRFGRRHPLRVEVRREGDRLVVTHERRPRDSGPTSGLGLRDLGERTRLVTGRELEIEATDLAFTVRVPLVPG